MIESNIKKCLLDMDGVLTDFVRGMCRLHFKKNPYLDSNYCGFYFNEAWGMESKEFWENADYKFWSNLDWTTYGRAIFKFVHERFGPENTCILTAPCETEGCFDGKMSWIREYLPRAYRRQFLVGSAKEFCAGPDRVLIDDRDENCLAFYKAGGHSILVPAQWNMNRAHKHDPFTYVKECFQEEHRLIA